MATPVQRVQDSGSNYQFFEKELLPKVSRSAFDLSYINNFTAEVGLIYPVYLQDTLPNSDYKIEVEALLRAVNPPVVPTLSRFRIFFHFFYSRYSELSKDFQFVVTKGRSGKYSGTLPTVKITTAAWAAGKYARSSLADMLGLQFGSYPDALTADVDAPYNAMPFMQYLRIYRDYYLNQNTEARDDSPWFPVDDDDFRLPKNFGSGDITAVKFNQDSSETLDLTELRYRWWTDDYFTSARPWPQKGDESSIPVNLVNVPVGVYVDKNGVSEFTQLQSYLFGNPANGHLSNMNVTGNMPFETPVNTFPTSMGPLSAKNPFNGDPDGPKAGKVYPFFANGDAGFNITLGALRELNANQRMLEKMARTDGSYGEFCKTFFGEVPKSAHSNRPTYIGGSYQALKISEVVNVAGIQSTAGGDIQSIQGQQTGHAMSYSSGFIGNFHSDDYGIIMGLMCIVPDTLYSQGIRRERSIRVQEELYLPERAGLSPQSILNQELFYSLTDDETNKDLFAYQDRLDEWRFRANEVHGKVADSTDKSFYPYTVARQFTISPSWNKTFLQMSKDNVRKDWLTSISEVPFVVQVANKVRGVLPLPYKAQPAELFSTNG